MFNDFYLIQLMIEYSTLFLFNKIPNFFARRQNFIQLVRFLFNNFRCSIGQRINKVTLKSKIWWRRMWRLRERTYFPPLIACWWRRKSKIIILILGFPEATLVLNRLEMEVSVFRAIVDMELDLDRNAGQVLVDSCVTLVE